MIRYNERTKQQTILFYLYAYTLICLLNYARSVSQIKTPQCAPRKRRGDTSGATAAVEEPSNLAAVRRHTHRAMLRMAYQNEMSARPQSRRVKRLRGRAAETIILHGDNPLMQEREYRPKLMSNGADTVTYTVGGSGGAGKLADAQSAEPASELPRKPNKRLLSGEDVRTPDSLREQLPLNRARDNKSSPFALRGYVRYSRASGKAATAT